MADDGKIDHTDTIFIGGVNFTMTEEEFMAEVMSWENVVSAYYPGPTKGWGTAKFASPKARTDFLERKHTFVLGSKIVDVKPFKRPKYKTPLQPEVNPVQLTRPVLVESFRPAVPLPSQLPQNLLVGMTQKPKVSSNVLTSSTSVAITGAILRYVGTSFAIVKTNSSGSGILCEEVLYICSNPDHNLACKLSDCPTYVNLTSLKQNGRTLSNVLQLGAQLSFVARKINVASEYTFQVTAAWPQASKKPSKAVPLDTSTLDEQLKKFYLEEKRSIKSTDPESFFESYGDENGHDMTAFGNFIQMFKTMSIPTDDHLLRKLLEEMYHLSSGKDVRDHVVNFYRKRHIELSSEACALLSANGKLLLQASRQCVTSNSRQVSGAMSLSPFIGGEGEHNSFDMDGEHLSRKFSEFLFNATTANGYFDFIKDKNLVRKHCVLAVDLWKKLGYPLVKLQMEYRDSPSSNTLKARWQRIMENVSEEQVDCMIDPSHLLQLTIQFFEREFKFLEDSSNNSIQTSSRSQTPLGNSIIRTESPIPGSTGVFKNSRMVPKPKSPPIYVSPVEPLNSLASVYKLVQPTSENFRSKVEETIEADSDLQPYKSFIQWLRKLHSSKHYVNVDGPESEAIFVYQTTRAWTQSGANPKEIMLIFSENWANPKCLFNEWSKLIKSKEGMWAPEAALQITSRYCFDVFEGTQKYKSIANSVFRLYDSVQFEESDEDGSPSKFFNLRGIVVHTFKEGFGVIQTPVGKVLFDCNTVFTLVNNKWVRGGPDRILSTHIFVKLHARTSSVDSSNRETYLYASKVWEHSENHAEPYTGSVMVGQVNYWSNAYPEFSKIVRVNNSLVFSSDYIKSSKLDYMVTFQSALNSRFDGYLDTTTHSEADFNLRGFHPLLKYFANTIFDDYKTSNQRYLASVKALSVSPCIPSLSYLESLFITYEALNMIESFQEVVEIALLNSSEHLGSKINIVHLLLDFFRFDRETQAKLRSVVQLMRSPSTLEQVLIFFSDVLNKVFAEKDLFENLFDESVETQREASASFISHNRNSPIPESKDTGRVIQEIQIMQTKLGELMNFKEVTGDTVSKLVEAVTTMDRNVKYLLDVIRKHDCSSGLLNHSSSSSSIQKVQYVRVISQGRSDICEIPTSESGNLSIQTLSAVFPGAIALLYKADSGNFRICVKDDKEFFHPAEGWGDTIFTVKTLDVNQMATRPTQLPPPISSIASSVFPSTNGISQRAFQTLGGRF